MGQRGAPPVRRQSKPGQPSAAAGASTGSRIAVFPTDLGWFALAGDERAVAGLTIGHSTEGEALDAIGRRHSGTAGPLDVTDWWPELRERLQRFAQGARVDFLDCALVLPPMTAFQKAVVDATRRIPFGGTVSYSELAKLAGYPRASRAVGSVMARNCIPVLIPCHRVITASGQVGGFGAGQGTVLKKRMLELESGASFQ